MSRAPHLHLHRRTLLAAALGLAGAPALAQFRVEVTGVGMTQIPIVLPALRGQDAAPQPVSEIVAADLERSGRFRILPSSESMDETRRPERAFWRERGADALAAGSIELNEGGRWNMRFRLWDIIQERDLGGEGYRVPAIDVRLGAHRMADYIYEKLTGEKGVFSTRLAYVTRAGEQYTLWVADADGKNAQAALTSAASIISPTWAPDGRRLAYVSFESRKPVVYVHDVATGQRRLVANFRGSNSAPAWSPDGRSLAVTLSRDGGSQLYLIPAGGGEPRRLTESRGIDTEPVFAPDGRTLYFVSDRGGAPQVYRMPVSGGQPQRVTFQGSYNVSPSISADGRWLAYVSRSGNAYRLHVMDLQDRSTAALTQTTDDEHPSFAPDSQLIVYATREGGRSVLMTTTVDGKIKARLDSPAGDIREPSWGPFND